MLGWATYLSRVTEAEHNITVPTCCDGKWLVISDTDSEEDLLSRAVKSFDIRAVWNVDNILKAKQSSYACTDPGQARLMSRWHTNMVGCSILMDSLLLGYNLTVYSSLYNAGIIVQDPCLPAQLFQENNELWFKNFI